tara:strand:+ start:2419 stop:2640 length:222 start_codon:yes stop_codon:yes gene_type:complete
MTEEQASIFSQEEKLDSMQKYLVSLQKKYDQTIERYGTGVRPSWVSAELAFIGIDINDALAEIETIKSSIEQN